MKPIEEKDSLLRQAFCNYYGDAVGVLRMATVTCDICGGIFSQSYLLSHKRLAHRKNSPTAARPSSENEAIQKIVSLYETLSVKGRRRVVRLLTAKDKEVQKDQKIH